MKIQTDRNGDVLMLLNDLYLIHQSDNTIADKYRSMHLLLDRICKQLTSEGTIRFSNFFSRLNYVCEKTGLDKHKTYLLNRFRLTANKAIRGELQPTEEHYFQDLKALSFAIGYFYKTAVPEKLQDILPKTEVYEPIQPSPKQLDRVRVEVWHKDDHYLYVLEEENPTLEPLKVRHSINGKNEEFNDTIEKTEKGSMLNLLHVTIDEDGIYEPEMIILEPDYLLDVSALAECVKDYSVHPFQYFYQKMMPRQNSAAILLGNAANVFFDEFVNEKTGSDISYASVMRKVFQSAPFEFSTCADFQSAEKKHQFFENTQLQFNHIKNVVQTTFPNLHIQREQASLEPSFLCEQLGIQGRLDFLQLHAANGKNVVIELKSGKAPFPESRTDLIGGNHASQAFLYQILIQKVLGVPFEGLETYIFYSRYADSSSNMRLSRPYMARIKQLLNIRNVIVATERNIANDTSGLAAKELITQINPHVLYLEPKNEQEKKFLDRFVIPPLQHFKAAFSNASALELEYFYSFYTFITREHYISKVGDVNMEQSKGIASLWLSSLSEKMEGGDILTDLLPDEKQTSDDQSVITFQIPEYSADFLPNFRQGDVVILYQRNSATDNVTNKQVFKGTIAQLSPSLISIRFRYKQNTQLDFSGKNKYAVEHDFLDASYTGMYRGLYAFLSARQDRKDLLLSQRKPQFHPLVNLSKSYATTELQEIVYKAKAAKDYFLLLGPPGTGKTSMALKAMVEEFYADGKSNILLLSYTNRAVDEICEALELADGQPDYIRIGSELSCDPKYRKRLLDNLLRTCEKRNEVTHEISRHRIFVGTVAGLLHKEALFMLKHFDVAIIDEASQILEPALIGILSAKNPYHGNAIDKFILIGDHKQLPAVVLQNESASQVCQPDLQKIGLTDRRNSLFERLFYNHKAEENPRAWSMLHKQGRMHPQIAMFPNVAFYENKLDLVPTPHQHENLNFKLSDTKNPFQQLICSNRLLFIRSEKHPDDKIIKSNTYEAQIVCKCVAEVYALYQQNQLNFSAESSVGIITPYRSQIALIKKAIFNLNIPELNAITVDTVERFQGSQRDIILYSFCVNHNSQLEILSANSFQENGNLIDRKLNVALTRARKQLFIIGNPVLLAENVVYRQFLDYLRSTSGYLEMHPQDFLAGDF